MAKKGNDNRTINTGGGTYIEGNVSTGGGDFVGGDQVTVDRSSQGAAELARLVAEIRGLLERADLDDDTRAAVRGDLVVVEAQLARPEPKKRLVLPRLKMMTEALGAAATLGEVAAKLPGLLEQAAALAQKVLK